jgi:hypothetical protein
VTVSEVEALSREQQPHQVVGLMQMAGIAKQMCRPCFQTGTFRDCLRALSLKRFDCPFQVETPQLPGALCCVRNEPAGLKFVVGKRGLQSQWRLQQLAETRSGLEACFVVVAQVLLAATHICLQVGRCSGVTVELASNEGKVLDGFQTVTRLEQENNDSRH